MRGYYEIRGYMCLSHIADPSLTDLLSKHAIMEECCRLCEDRCDNAPLILIPIQSLLLEVMDAVEFLYESPDQVLPDGDYFDPDNLYAWDVVSSVCVGAFASNVEELLIDLLSEAAREHEWIHSLHGNSVQVVRWEWESFVATVKSESRFIFMPNADGEIMDSPGQHAAAFLRSLVPYVENHDLGLLLDIPPGSEFFRGRLIQNPRSTLRGAKDLGPAPACISTANRMSPAGIPMFYASAAATTAVQEIAAHGTHNFARIGTFRNQRSLTVLDLTGVLTLPSIFDRNQRTAYGVFQFFSDFACAVAAPLLPDSRPHVEYVPTQIVTEFFRWVPKTRIDGIRLSSAQDAEPTYVLFFDQDEVGDAGSPLPGSTARRSLLPAEEDSSNSRENSQPVFTLNPEEVKTYRVLRSIEVELV